MAGLIAFILGAFIVTFSAANQMGPLYCVPVAVGWYILLLNSSKKVRKRS
jgi:hypothetical protein